MDCPHCKLINPPGTRRCECGYDFDAGVVLDSYLTDNEQIAIAEDRAMNQSTRRFYGWRLARLLIIMAVALAYFIKEWVLSE